MMWQEISDRISEATAEKFEVSQCASVSGGSINQAYLVADDRRKFFVKTNGAEKVGMFEAEVIALSQIYATKTMLVPQPVCWGVTDRIAYIVMEWIELGHKQDWNLFGTMLAAMHRVTNHKFGWQQQNTIGSTPQINTWNQDWVEFFSEQRLGYQLQLAQRKGFRSSIPTGKLLEAATSFFHNYNPQPSMVHGDLWGGNAGFSDRGEPVIYDPALYFGDREVDIAMTELFGGFPAQFYQAYDLAFPLDPGYKQRKTLYNLYHILNHFNLFGGGYGSQANRMIESIIQLSKN